MSNKRCVMARCEYWDTFTGWGKAHLVRYWTTRKGSEPGQETQHSILHRWEQCSGEPTVCTRRFPLAETGLAWARLQSLVSPMRWRSVEWCNKIETRSPTNGRR